MLVLWAIGIIVILLFGFTVLFGAPYVPTLKNRTKDALDLLDLKPGDRLLELGSGDGRLLLEASKRGIKSTGYELNPILVAYSRIKLWRYRKFTTVKCQNYWTQKLPEAEGIYVFLLNSYMEKLDRKVLSEAIKPIKVVSFGFQIPCRKPSKEINGMRLYIYKD